MKKTLFILFAVLLTLNFSLNAQVKKSTTTKKAPAKKTTTTPAKTTSAPVEEKKSNEQTQSKKTETNTTETKKSEEKKSETKSSGNSIFSSDKTPRYKAAIGVKFLWGISLTGKYFFKNNQAIEAILRYRGYGGVASEIGLAVLYEYHGNFNEIDGLGYYFGGGAYAGHFSYKSKYKYANEYFDAYGEGNRTNFGISAVIGTEYKFEDLPIAISADWMPSFSVNGGGFGGANGGLGVKYTF